MKIFWLALWAVTAAAAARAETRPGSLTLSATAGSADYRAGALDAKVGLDDTWRLGLGAGVSRSGTAGNTSSFSAGADAKLSDWALRLKLQGSREPNEVSSFGFAPGVTWTMSSLWDGELLTLLSLDYERNRYTQSISFRQRSLTQAFVQRVFRIGGSQDLSERLTLFAALERYRYNESASQINQAVGSRRLAFGTLDAFIGGFPASTAALGLDWQFTERWTLSPHAGNTKSVVDGQKTRNYGLGLAYEFSAAWSLALDYTRSRPDAGTKTDLFSLDLGYSL